MRAHDLYASMQGEPIFEDEDREGEAAFWAPEPFNDGMLWVGKFKGRSPWEIHRDSDELLHVLKGEVEVTVLTNDATNTATVPAGSVFVVPKNHWHRVKASDEVTVCGVTPCPTEHSSAEDPRKA